MVNGTPLVSSTFSRVSTSLARNVILANLQRLQASILLTQEQMSTGLRLIRPSIDPIGANKVFDFDLGIRKIDQFLRNIGDVEARLSTSENALAKTEELIDRAQVILLSQLNASATAQTRLLAAQEVQNLLDQAARLANTTLNGRFLFGGERTNAAPMAQVGSTFAYVGTPDATFISVADALSFQSNVQAGRAFGAISDELRGIDATTGLAVDLNPAVVSGTTATALNGGQGFAPGSIQITGSSGTAIVNLTTADTVGDIIEFINLVASSTGVTAAINPANNGLMLTDAAAGTITVQEVAGGRTARTLGILTPAGGSLSPVVGTDLNPAVTADTVLGDLFGGVGLTVSGITITNATANQTFAATLGPTAFASGNTVGQLVEAINNSGTFTLAQINSQRTGIDIFSRLSASRLTVTEATPTGTTALELGLRYDATTAARVKLSDLNNGLGVGSINGPDIRITLRNGTQLVFDIDNGTFVRDVVAQLDADPNLTATLSPTGQIIVTDLTAGPNQFRIENMPGSFAATNLGIEQSTAGAVITGTPLSFVGVQAEGVFTALARLRDALQANSTDGIQAAQRLLDISKNKLLEARGELGARLSALELTRGRIDTEKDLITRLRGEIRDIDFTEAATRFQQENVILQAALATSVRALQVTVFNFL